MAKAAMPAGHAPTAPPVSLVSDRSVKRTYELVTRDGGRVGAMPGARSASLTQSAQAVLKRGGEMAWTDVGEPIDWLNARIRCGYEIEGMGDAGKWGLGVYLPTKPVNQRNGEILRADVQLLDVAKVLAGASVESGYSLKAGANVTDAIKALIAYTGETTAAVTDSDKTLPSARTWEPGTFILPIINELADSIGYFALATDGDGRLKVEPYVRPAQRPLAWEFVDGASAIYRNLWTEEQDLADVPNHVIAVAQGTEGEHGLYSSAFNDDPSSPYSRARRGYPITHRIEREAADQAALDVLARRYLIEATTPTRSVKIDALPLPLEANNAVRFASSAAGIDGRFVVTNIELGHAETDLATYTLREVVDL